MQDTTVQNLIINKLTQAQYENIASPSNTELYLIPDVGIIVDSALSPTSENPVQNKVIYAVIGNIETLLSEV